MYGSVVYFDRPASPCKTSPSAFCPTRRWLDCEGRWQLLKISGSTCQLDVDVHGASAQGEHHHDRPPQLQTLREANTPASLGARRDARHALPRCFILPAVGNRSSVAPGPNPSLLPVLFTRNILAVSQGGLAFSQLIFPGLFWSNPPCRGQGPGLSPSLSVFPLRLYHDSGSWILGFWGNPAPLHNLRAPQTLPTSNSDRLLPTYPQHFPCALKVEPSRRHYLVPTSTYRTRRATLVERWQGSGAVAPAILLPLHNAHLPH